MREIFDHCGKGAYVCIFLTQPNGYTLTPTDNLPAYLSATPPSTSYTLTMESLVHISSLYNSWLIREACERGYPVIDIEQKLPKTLAIHYDDVHFTELGTEMLADTVIAYVKPLLAGDPLPATACDGSE